MIFFRPLSRIHDNQRFASALVVILSTFAVLVSAFAQAARTNSRATPKKRLTQAEWYAEQNKAQEKRLQAAHEFWTHRSISKDDIYELPAVKKLGIKPPSL